MQRVGQEVGIALEALKPTDRPVFPSGGQEKGSVCRIFSPARHKTPKEKETKGKRYFPRN